MVANARKHPSRVLPWYGLKAMQAIHQARSYFGVDVGFHDSWFFIALLIMFSVGGLASIEKEAVCCRGSRASVRI